MRKTSKLKIADPCKFIVIVSILIVAIIFMFSIINSLKSTEIPYEIKTIYISEGETLWEIAEQYRLENQDPRDYIYKIRELNNIGTSELQEGQELKVIVYEEK